MKDNTASQLKALCSDSTVSGPKLRPKGVRRGHNTEDFPPQGKCQFLCARPIESPKRCAMHNSTELTITIPETTSLLLTIPANDYAPCTMSIYRSAPAEKGHLGRHDDHELDVHVQRQIRLDIATQPRQRKKARHQMPDLS